MPGMLPTSTWTATTSSGILLNTSGQQQVDPGLTVLLGDSSHFFRIASKLTGITTTSSGILLNTSGQQPLLLDRLQIDRNNIYTFRIASKLDSDSTYLLRIVSKFIRIAVIQPGSLPNPFGQQLTHLEFAVSFGTAICTFGQSSHFIDPKVHAQHQNFLWDVDSHLYRSDTTGSYVAGRSPFPALDAFVESIASVGSASGKIQSWYWFSAYGLMVYNMSRNRYCERIGREHKSNHVMYVVDFQRAGYYQKCHDPDCRGYRSPLRPLPWDVFPDSSTLSNSSQIENYEEVISIDIDLQVGNTNMDAFDNEQLLKDYCTDMSWWHEAINFAECIENMRNLSDFSVLDEDIMDDDCAWWTDVEKIVSQVE